MEQTNAIAWYKFAFAIAHLDFSAIFIEEPIRQSGAPEFCQDKRAGLYDAMQAMGLASLKPAFEVTFGT